VATVGVTKNELFGENKAPLPKVAVASKPRIVRAAAPVQPIRRAQCVEVIQHGMLALSCF
jgi:deoxyinosine 3'endonuclease (endonuclease V)